MSEKRSVCAMELTPASKDEMAASWEKYVDDNGLSTGVVMEITNYCPNDCAHCYANTVMGKNTTQMEPETFSDCIEAISQDESKKPKEIWFCGGEPTFNSHLGEYLKKAKEPQFDFDTFIVTTGETFVDQDYCRSVLPYTDEVDITIRGSGAFHDLMMLPAEDELFSAIPEGLSADEKAKYVLDLANNKDDAAKHFNNTIQGLKNIAEISREIGSDTSLCLNIDMQTTTDLASIVDLLNTNNIPIDGIIVQIQTFSEENAELADVVPNIWRKPTTRMVEEYYKQAQELMESGKFEGKIEIIDHISDEIIAELAAKGIDLGDFYNPVATPAIAPNGIVRQNVVKETNIYGNN